MTTITEVGVEPTTQSTQAATSWRATSATWTKYYALRLSIGDIAAVAIALTLSHFVLFGFSSAPISSNGALDQLVQQAQISLGVGALWVAALRIIDSRDKRIVGAGTTEYKRVVDASLLTFVGYLVAAYFLQLEIPRVFALVAFPLTTLLILVNRWLWRQWLVAKRRKGLYTSRVVLVGSKSSVLRTAKDLAQSPAFGYEVVAVSLTGKHQNTPLVVNGVELPFIGALEDVAPRLDSYGATTVMVTGSEHLSAQRVREMSWGLDAERHQLLLAPGITDVAGSRVHLRPVAGLPLVHVETPSQEGPRLVAKRAFDVTLSALMLIGLLPVFAIVAPLIKRADGGPVFYTQERVGRDGEVFKILKFRSMYADADARRAELVAAQGIAKGLFKMADDPRITPVGRILRRYSLDELPQLINVLRGDMSLVGPRPALPEEVAEYDVKERRRLVVTPGLSGLWQVSGRSNLAWEDGIRLDLYYVENWSMTGDIVILWRTARTVLFPEGAY